MQLGEILVRHSFISAQQLHVVLTEQRTTGLPVGQQLLIHDWITADVLDRALKEQYWRRQGRWIID